MIGLLIPLAARLGVPESARRFAAIGMLVLLLALLCLGARVGFRIWLAGHDRQVIAADRAAANAEESKTVIRADRAAGASKDARDGTFATEQDQLKKDADDAARTGDSPLDALFDELR